MSAKTEVYFDRDKIVKYFLSAKQRLKFAKEEPDLRGFMDKPSVRSNSHKLKPPEKETFFYQNLNGANIYLHYLCQEFIEKCIDLEQAPKVIELVEA